ncbi:MAG: hypothetical protein HY231_26850 [Acidobacteria bacterium]|nr:hypothetical protein [Acidobacteriota bacterium]
MKFARYVFLIAGIYGLLVLAPQYFLEAKTGTAYPLAVPHPEFHYGFTGVALVWQLVFLAVARDPLRYRLMMILGALAKFSFGIAAHVLYVQKRISTLLLGLATIDVLLGLLFIAAYIKTAEQ